MRWQIKKAVARFSSLSLFAKMLVLMMILTVASFFLQSSLSREASRAESDAVAGFLSTILSYETSFGAFVIDNIRKIGHFCEY